MKKFWALLSLVLLAGCSSTVNSESDLSSRDFMFAQMMIPHHEQAIEISDLALKNSSNQEIRELATKIKSEQAPEIQLMKSWTDAHMGSHMGSHGGHMMNGMLSEEEIHELENTSGVEFNRLFLKGMIAHHEGAIEMARDVENSKNEEVSKLARSIITSQRAEIEYMKELLKSL